MAKKTRKKEARQAARAEQAPSRGNPRPPSTPSAGGKSRPTNRSALKGPVVVYGEGATPGRRDSANPRDPPPSSKRIFPAASSASGRQNASSAAQRRRVLRHHTDDDLLSHFRSQLHASTFRLLNEQLYNAPIAFARRLLADRATFEDYHVGYRQQLARWPVNPNEVIVAALLGDRRGRFLAHKAKGMPGSLPASWVVADMGCGEAAIAAALGPRGYTVHSFDLVALNERVTVADLAAVPLEGNSVDVCIFSLSLMSTDYEKGLFEAFRILKPNRLLKVVEVRSRIPSAKKFAEMVESIGFTLDYQDVVGDYFVAFDFLKNNQEDANPNLAHPPGEVLLPSLYKKR
ncbi:unnamed protein product, partial [Phytomonas sp. EM1]